MNQRHMPPSERTTTMPSQKTEPVTIARIAALLRANPEADFSRAEIAKLLGRKKTAHLIRIIEDAVIANEICKASFQPAKGRPFFIYSYTEYLPF
jgi:predicted ArsR family transcriptional regulator